MSSFPNAVLDSLQSRTLPVPCAAQEASEAEEEDTWEEPWAVVEAKVDAETQRQRRREAKAEVEAGAGAERQRQKKKCRQSHT